MISCRLKAIIRGLSCTIFSTKACFHSPNNTLHVNFFIHWSTNGWCYDACGERKSGKEWNLFSLEPFSVKIECCETNTKIINLAN